MKRILFSFFSLSTLFSQSFAQNSWLPVVSNGFGDNFNEYIYSMTSFKGEVYAGVGNSSGQVYKSATGNMNDWSATLSPAYFNRFEAFGVTAQDSGYIYASGYCNFNDYPTVFRSVDGNNWTPFYINYSMESMNHVIPYSGAGTTDSIYIIDQYYMGSRIYKAAYNNNDPTNASLTWQTIFDFSSINAYTHVTASLVANGKIYLATDNGGMLWTTSNGITFTQNDSVGYGFGNSNNFQINGLAQFGGYIYLATTNNLDGCQIWRSNDDLNWTLVNQFPNVNQKAEKLYVSAGKLWFVSSSSSGIAIFSSADGLTFTQSNTDGFGSTGNVSDFASITEFNNQLYVGFRNTYYMPLVLGRGGSMSTGGQIWRTCLVTPPSINLGSDITVCQGVYSTFDAGAGMSSYSWSTGDTTQIINTNYNGPLSCVVTGTNGCSSADTVMINSINSPSISINYPNNDMPGSDVICKGDTLYFSVSANSNVWIPSVPFPTITNDTINDYSYSYDTITVSGINGLAGDALYKVTIDSLYHTYCGDVEMRLYAPDGSSILLNNGSGGGSQNFIGTEFYSAATMGINSGSGPFTGSYYPYEPFYYLTGSPNGQWRLELYDHAGGDVGVLKGWKLQFAEPDTTMNISWSPAATFISASNILNGVALPPASSQYTLSVTNSLGCTTSDSIFITVPSIDITATDDSICYGASTILSAIGQNIMWQADPTLSDTIGPIVTAMPNTTTVYYASDTVMGCYVQDSITIYYSPIINLTTSADDTICYSTTASISATVTGGVAPYNYLWSGGAFSGTNATELVSPAATTNYSVFVTDLFGCPASGNTNIVVTPSTDIDGHVTYSGGALSNGGTVVIYNYLPFNISFDTVAMTTLNTTGDYHFAAVNYGDYIIKVFPNTSFPTLIPTYYGDTYLWDSATVINHGCTINDVANIVMSEQQTLSGPGLLGGRIVEGPGFQRLEGDPIPGIDVKLGRNPGGQLIINTTTDNNGVYTFANLPLNDGGVNGVSYTVYADIPGLDRDSSYTVTIDATTPVLDSLNYLVDSTTIYIVPTSSTGISNISVAKENKFNVYPNPFKDGLNIEYTLPVEADVKLELYNMLGVREELFVNTKQQSGEHKYYLNNRLSNGVYFIHLTINNKTTTQRIIKID